MKIISFYTTFARPLTALIVSCVALSALATSDPIDQLAKALKEIVQPADIVTPTRAIEILGKNIIYKDDVNHIYQIGVTSQDANECWMYGPRNTLFLTTMLSGINKSEFDALYQDMKDTNNIDAFKKELYKIQVYKDAMDNTEYGDISLKKIVDIFKLETDNKKIPKDSKSLIDLMGECRFTPGLDGSSQETIKKVEGLDDNASLPLAQEADCSNTAPILKLQNNVISLIGIDLSATEGHATSLVICYYNGTYYYFFADSLSNNPSLDVIMIIKKFVEMPNAYKNALLRRYTHALVNRAATSKTKNRSVRLLTDEIGKYTKENLIQLDLFKNIYKAYLQKFFETVTPESSAPAGSTVSLSKKLFDAIYNFVEAKLAKKDLSQETAILKENLKNEGLDQEKTFKEEVEDTLNNVIMRYKE